MHEPGWLAVLPHGERIALSLRAAGVPAVRVDDIAEAVEGAGAPVVLIGHFTGAPAAIRYAQTHSGLAALVLVSPVLGMWDGASAELADLMDEVALGPALGDLPTLWLHGSDDEIVPIAATRAGTDRIRGLRFEEHVVPGLLTDGEVVTQVLEFARRVV
ncbi:alpha/beta hydrolase [Lentzea sp. HUAS12]|uniref:alpha/beta hydrolase n=1 Tax=Lentzea sp. HUAS12 TaxID=2951806 RepID=UPI0020A1E56A|nr:lysophospholipase [Lentzea sp. HUAS12]USX49493.1 lysophospholipase [Lentzea sp. HUAS12]